jgi:WD40 repeat protein
MTKKSALPECKQLQAVSHPDDWPLGVLFAPNDQSVMIADRGPPQVFEWASGTRLADCAGGPAVGEYGCKLARPLPGVIGVNGKTLDLVSVADGSILGSYFAWGVYLGPAVVMGIANYVITPDRKFIVYGDNSNQGLIGTELSELENAYPEPVDQKRTWDINSKTSFATCLAMTPQGEHFVTGGRDKTVRLWSTRTGQEVHQVGVHDGWVQDVKVFGNGRLAATAGRDRVVRLWDLFGAKELFQLTGHRKEILTLAITADDRLLISAGGDGARVWNLATHTCIAQFTGHGKSISCIDISSDNRFAVTGAKEHHIRVWELPG